MLALSGLSLGIAVGQILALRIPRIQQALAGLIMVGFIWAGVAKVQSVLSSQALAQSRSIDHFAELNGHCGPDLAASMRKLLESKESTIESTIKNYFHSIQCRNDHFLLLEKQGRLECIAGETPVECRVRWMSVFAERGHWTFSTRKMFFDRIMAVWNEAKQEEQLVNFVLRDHEIESGRQSLVKQIGLDHGPREMVAVQLREEVENMRLTEKLFTLAQSVLDEQKDKTSPHSIKFKDAFAEASAKLMRLPDYEKELNRISGEQ